MNAAIRAGRARSVDRELTHTGLAAHSCLDPCLTWADACAHAGPRRTDVDRAASTSGRSAMPPPHRRRALRPGATNPQPVAVQGKRSTRQRPRLSIRLRPPRALRPTYSRTCLADTLSQLLCDLIASWIPNGPMRLKPWFGRCRTIGRCSGSAMPRFAPRSTCW